MKCPKCNYVSHDYLDACRKCGIDLMLFKQDIGLLVLQPGMLDLSLVLGGAGADDLFESVEEGVTMHASNDDDFDISLDDYTEHAGMRRAPAGAPRSGRPETEPEVAGMDHLTLELDASDLPPEMTARLRAAEAIADEPPVTPTQPPGEPGATTLPGHVTLEIEPEDISSDLATAMLQHNVPSDPSPPQDMPALLATQDIPPLPLDVSHVDWAHRLPAEAPEAQVLDEVETGNIDEAISVADFSGALASLPLQDVVLAEDTPIASAEAAPEVVDPTLPTIKVLDATAALAQTDAVESSAPAETEKATDLVRDNVVLSVDDGAVPTLDETSLTCADEAMPHPPSVGAWASAAAETPPEGLLTSSDMFALENLEDPVPMEHLTLELVPPALPEDAPYTPLPDAPEIPEPFTNAGTEPDEAVSGADLADIPLPDHLTLELDRSGMAPESSSLLPDHLQLDNPPGDIQPKMPPHDDQADDEHELLLDLDSFELDDDEPA
jgi:hypothetical protein